MQWRTQKEYLEMLTLNWITHDMQGALLRFYDVDLTTVRADGVYVIYSPVDAFSAANAFALKNMFGAPKTVYVGQGVVADRLQQHRSNQTMRSMNSQNTLVVAFAPVAASLRDGVERYLANRLQPMLGDVHPNAAPVAVNLPFAA
jgi:hypothetical protein